jgi:hypothetical protein
MAINLRDGYEWVLVGNGGRLHIGPVSASARETLCGKHHSLRVTPAVVSETYACRICLAKYRRFQTEGECHD